MNTLKVTEKKTKVCNGCYFSSACYSPDGKYLATGESNIVRIWDASNGQEYAKYNHGSCIYLFNLLIINYHLFLVVRGLCFSSDSKTLVSSCDDYSIIAYNVQTKT